MPRSTRWICAGVPHHATQRGNHRDPVFYSRADYLIYLHWLREYGEQHDVDVLAYCLMTNHVHLVVVPTSKNGLPDLMQSLHARYAQRVNRMTQRNGHLWQGRYFASALDQRHLWAAIRYVERNPVRAGMVQRAEDYPWSSAYAHCGLAHDPVLSTDPGWLQQVRGIGGWSTWLAAGDESDALVALRHAADRNLPCGDDQFIARLEHEAGRKLARRSYCRAAG